MKPLILVLSAIIIASCGMAGNGSFDSDRYPEKSKLLTDSSTIFKLPMEVLEIIKKHYYFEESETFKVVISDSTDYISISHNEFFDGESEPIQSTIIGIPKTTHLIGDINSDGKFDLIIPVDYFGGGSELIWDDIFIFLNDGQNYFILAGEPQTDKTICECNDGGIPGPCELKKITNGIIEAILYCYDEADANCCPSLEYSVKLKYKNGKIHMTEKSLIRKISQE